MELVSERCGEYLLCTGVFGWPIDWTRLALLGTTLEMIVMMMMLMMMMLQTTLAVLITGEVLVGTEVGTKEVSSIGLLAACWLATAVEG